MNADPDPGSDPQHRALILCVLADMSTCTRGMCAGSSCRIAATTGTACTTTSPRMRWRSVLPIQQIWVEFGSAGKLPLNQGWDF
jgi:hypothetical protein